VVMFRLYQYLPILTFLVLGVLAMISGNIFVLYFQVPLIAMLFLLRRPPASELARSKVATPLAKGLSRLRR
jgi:hypothetical protein